MPGSAPRSARSAAASSALVYGWCGLIECADRELLEDASREHDGDAIGSIDDERDVVDSRSIAALGAPPEEQEIDELRLEHRVEARGGFVRNDELGIGHEDRREPDATLLAARELGRARPSAMEEPDLMEHASTTSAADFARAVEARGLGEDRPHIEARD
jgi:hypothetical protein